MYIADGHCDYLYKMMRQQLPVINRTVLSKANVKMQNFAIFVEPDGSVRDISRKITAQIEIFCKEIVSSSDVVWLKDAKDLRTSTGLYALLSLEGCDALDHQEHLFDTLWKTGVRIYGITWNHDNAFATCCHSRKRSGLTAKGRKFVSKLVDYQGIIDVSHISQRAFWDLLDTSEHAAALIASHSNCRSLCDHPRNLTDEQIRALAANDGMIGINFVPEFLNSNGQAELDDVLRHIEHVLTLVGDRHVAIGSDYDGAQMAIGCETPLTTFPNLANALVKRYNRDTAEKIMYRNWYNYFKKHLPICRSGQ